MIFYIRNNQLGGCSREHLLSADSFARMSDSEVAMRYPGEWKFAGGVVDPGETPQQAAMILGERAVARRKGLGVARLSWYPFWGWSHKPRVTKGKVGMMFWGSAYTGKCWNGVPFLFFFSQV